MGGKIKTLIIDDSKTFNNMIKAFFEALDNYKIYQAFNLAEAKEILFSDSIDYLFLDLNLPDGNGVELVDIIQENFSCKVIVMTGNEDPILRDKIFEKGVIDYFIKTTPIPIIGNGADILIKNIESHKNTNILTIDDSDFVRTILKKILESKDYNVFEASSAKEGKEIIKNNEVHLILLDLIMPGIDGMSFLEDIKSSRNYNEIPIIVVSADNSRENYSRVLKQGASDFIKKPFVVEEVLLKCDIHIKSFFHNKKVIEKEKEILKQSTMISLQKKEIEKQKFVSSLIQNIAHQWRQPLSIISTLSSGVKLEVEYNQISKDEIMKRMDSIVKNTKYLSDIIDTFSKDTIECGTKEKINISKLFDSILEEKKSYIEKSNIKVFKNILDIEIEVCTKELINILLSLFDNIQEHAKDVKHIFIEVFIKDKELNIVIKDDGKGVEEILLNRLFEPYFTTSHQSIGKGIELYNIQKTLKGYFSGEIKVKNVEYEFENKKLKGFGVYIKFPVVYSLLSS